MAVRTHMRELCGALFFSLSLLHGMQPGNWAMQPSYVPGQSTTPLGQSVFYGQSPFLSSPMAVPSFSAQPMCIGSMPAVMPCQFYALPYSSSSQVTQFAMQNLYDIPCFKSARTFFGISSVFDAFFLKVQKACDALVCNHQVPPYLRVSILERLDDVIHLFKAFADDEVAQENLGALRNCISLLNNDLTSIELYLVTQEEKQLFVSLKMSMEDAFKERFGVSGSCQVIEINEKGQSEEWLIGSTSASSSASSSVQTPDSESATPRPWTPLTSPCLVDKHFFEDLQKNVTSSQQASRAATPVQPVKESVSAPLSRASSYVKLSLLKRPKSRGNSMALYSLPTGEPAERYSGYFTGNVQQ